MYRNKCHYIYLYKTHLGLSFSLQLYLESDIVFVNIFDDDPDCDYCWIKDSDYVFIIGAQSIHCRSSVVRLC